MPVWSKGEQIGDSVILDQTLYYPGAGERLVPRRLWRDKVVRLLPASGGSLVSVNRDACLLFSGGAFTDAVTLTWWRHWSATRIGSLVDIGYTFELDAVYSNSGRQAQLASQQTYTLTIHYSDADTGSAIENTLALYHWDGSQWRKDKSSVLDTTANVLTATPDRLSLWAVLGETWHTFLPCVLRKH